MNLNLLAAKDCVKIYDLEGYAEVSSLFVEDIKYVAPPRVSRSTASHSINTRIIVKADTGHTADIVMSLLEDVQ